MSMILATTWVRRGVAAQYPTKYELDDAELHRISKLARLHLEDARADLRAAQKGEGSNSEGLVSRENGESNREVVDTTPPTQNDEDDLKEYNLDDYDDDDELGDEVENSNLFGNIGSLAYYAPHEEDPYLQLPKGEDTDNEEREELEIQPTDNLILAAKVEDEVAHLEVYVYEDEGDNLYVHHDMMLQAVPLCVEWVDVPVGRESGKAAHGNYVAVGTMSPTIEIFNLDVVDNMFPDAILGEEVEDSLSRDQSPRKKKKRRKANDDYHVDAVLALAANRHHRNLLTSGSADKTVKLWDLNTSQCAKSYTMHTDKVSALDWHPKELTVLLSGGYDREVVVTDMRAPDAKATRWRVEADVEKVRWNIHDPNYFYVTTEAGTVHYFDLKASSMSGNSIKPTWTLQAHDGAVSSFDINPIVPGFLVTGSEDKKVKLWNVVDNKPTMVVSRNLEIGKVFATQFAPDPEVGFRLSVAGSKGRLQVWDTSTNSSVRNVFSQRIKMPASTIEERLIATNDDASDEDEEEEGGVPTSQDDGWESMEED